MKRSVLDAEVSCFKSYGGRKPANVNLLTWLTSDKYADQVIELRHLEGKAERDKIKAGLPAVTVSGIFDPVRKEENLVKHSGLICIDIDPKGNEHIANFMDLKQELFKIRNVAYAGLSVSGKGFFLIIPIAHPKRHKQHFQAICNDLLAYGVAIDLAPQNVASLRGYSYDPDALFRHYAIPYRKWGRPQPKKTRRQSVHFSPGRHVIAIQEKVEALIQQIVERQIDITTEEPDWFRLACALANEFGEIGRPYFHAISQFYCKYDSTEADKKFSHALKGRYRQITIGTFFKLARQSTL